MTTISLPTTLIDGNGFSWNLDVFGSAVKNGFNPFDGRFGLFGAFVDGDDTAEGEDGDRELAIAPITLFTGRGGSLVQFSSGGSIETSAESNPQLLRKVYVPEDDGFIRYLDTIVHTGTVEANFRFTTFTNLGFDGRETFVTTSGGDGAFTLDDTWFALDDGAGGNPAAAYVIGNGGGIAPSATNRVGDNLSYTFDMTLAPGESRSILHFGVQANSPEDAVDTARALSGPTPAGLEGLSEEELARILNFDLGRTPTPVILDGTDGADLLQGGLLADTLRGLAGDDTLRGSDGADSLSGNTGRDSIDGGRGNDTLSGGAGDDTVTGGAGDDRLFGGAGDDFIFGGYQGDDVAWGGDGADRFFSAGVGSGTMQVMDYDAAEGDVLVVGDGSGGFDVSDFELRGVTMEKAGLPGLTFRPTELVRLTDSGETLTLFTFGADLAGDSIVVRLPAYTSAETATFDFM